MELAEVREELPRVPPAQEAADLPTPDEALPGRDTALPVAATHTVLGTPLRGPLPTGLEVAVFGMGCFWGAEELFWKLPGVYSTAVGYAGGFTPNPTYEEIVLRPTGHTEAVLVVYDPAVSYENLLKVFWENHDPTQGMRQGNDIGTQYRSAIYATTDEQLAAAEASREAFAPVVGAAGLRRDHHRDRQPGGLLLRRGHHQQYLSDSRTRTATATTAPTA